MVVAYDMSTAEAAYGNSTGIRSHADKAVNGNFCFLVIAAVRVDIFNSLNNTLAALQAVYIGCVGAVIIPYTAGKRQVQLSISVLMSACPYSTISNCQINFTVVTYSRCCSTRLHNAAKEIASSNSQVDFAAISNSKIAL